MRVSILASCCLDRAHETLTSTRLMLGQRLNCHNTASRPECRVDTLHTVCGVHLPAGAETAHGHPPAAPQAHSPARLRQLPGCCLPAVRAARGPSQHALACAPGASLLQDVRSHAMRSDQCRMWGGDVLTSSWHMTPALRIWQMCEQIVSMASAAGNCVKTMTAAQ